MVNGCVVNRCSVAGLCAAAFVLLAATPVRAQSGGVHTASPGAANAGVCTGADTSATAPNQDLYCVRLLPRPLVRGASGVAALHPSASPFGVALTADGRQVYGVTLELRNLPPPEALGPYSTYVVWAAPPSLAPLVKLGEAGNGSTALDPVALNKFLLFVSAEVSGDVARRSGPLVLRGMSPSMRMSDTHLTGLTGGPLPGEEDEPDAAHQHDTPGPHWAMPPMDPRVAPMPMAGFERAVPDAIPYLPGWMVDADTLPFAVPREVVPLADGDTLRLEARFVRRTINGRTFVMYGFNGQYPGPLIRVDQGAEIVVDFTNRVEWATTVHWHGVRLENRFDGVPHLTQEPVEPGETFRYRVRFPDAGLYWYHPHHREDVTQDLGLYGNILVGAPQPDYYGPAHRDEVLMLDDLLVGEAGLVPFGRERATHAVMGRFGNLLLVNGEPDYSLSVRRGEVVRFHLTNVSNVRTFNLGFGGAQIKVVASDVSRFEHEQWTESVVIAPAERYIVDVRFPVAGTFLLANRVQAIDHAADRFFASVDTLGTIQVGEQPAKPDLAAAFATLRTHDEVRAEIEAYREHFNRPPDRELTLALESTALPFALEQIMALEAISYVHPVEWAGTMPMMDWLPTSAEVRWILREPATGRENEEIQWRFTVGDVVKLRIHNERRVIHPMAHPIHIHGQRFLVLAVNGVPNENLVWKDTVLVPVGATADILLELSNPGEWMLHCHIAEHLEAGMKMVFSAEPPG